MGGLINVEDSVLVVIDVQAPFLHKLDKSVADGLADRIGWLTRVADKLAVPIVATVEDPDRNGGLVEVVEASRPPGVFVHPKFVFDLAADPEILESVVATGRRTAILIGLETDVCVAHSAVGLRELGYRVVVVSDATGSPSHEAGLARVARLGAEILPVRTLYYEWVRTVAAAAALRGKPGIADLPADLVL